ncbi:MAG: universal stress protein [Bacteroidota bacterium]
MFENILLAVDGSEHAMKAAHVASSLANAMSSQTLRIVVAYDTIPVHIGDPYMQNALNARISETEEILQSAVQVVWAVSAQIYTEMIEGNPAETIIEVARNRNTDVIIMGARGLGKLAGLPLGSTSQKVLSLAPCPVLIVR